MACRSSQPAVPISNSAAPNRGRGPSTGDGHFYFSTSTTSCGFRPRRKSSVFLRSNWGSSASMLRKKRSWLARAKLGAFEDRVIRLGQAVGDEHAKGRTERGKEDGQLKGHRDEHRSAVQRLAGDIERIVYDRDPIAQGVARDGTEQPKAKTSQGNLVRGKPMASPKPWMGMGE